MYNPYENNNKPNQNGEPETPANPPVNTPVTQPPVQGQSPVYGQNPVPPQNSYTWGSNTQTTYTRPPVSYQAQPQPPIPPKKKNSKIGLRIAALLLCCVVSSAASVGGFVALIQTGVIAIESGDGDKAAFTIARVSGKTEQQSEEVGVLTKQQIADKVIPSVVCIQNYQLTQRFGMFGTGSEQTDSSEISPVGEGSGIVMSEDGYIITNAHVVSGASALKVVMSNGTTYEAKLIGSDEVTDLAVIKVEATGLTPADFGSSADLSVADDVVAIGNPGGMAFNSSVTMGYVSALNREITNSETGYKMNCIQTDAAINPGNSGGALVNQYGQVVGINSAKFVATGYEGLGFAIPIDTAQPIITDLKDYGYVKDRAVLGISGEYVDAMTARFYGFSTGMYVAQVTSAEAQKAGLKEGDIITKIDDVDVTSSSTITSVVTTKKPGDTVELTVDRALEGMQDISITVKLTEYEKSTSDSQENP